MLCNITICVGSKCNSSNQNLFTASEIKLSPSNYLIITLITGFLSKTVLIKIKQKCILKLYSYLIRSILLYKAMDINRCSLLDNRLILQVGGHGRRREDDTNYDDVNMDMSEVTTLYLPPRSHVDQTQTQIFRIAINIYSYCICSVYCSNSHITINK